MKFSTPVINIKNWLNRLLGYADGENYLDNCDNNENNVYGDIYHDNGDNDNNNVNGDDYLI